MSWMLRWFIPENTISPTLDGERAAPATVEAGHPATSEPWFSQTSSGHIGPIRIPPGFFSLAAFLLLVLAIARIVSTYHVFNQTDDEPAHLACGMEWLDQGKYHYEHQHPPLARVAVAIGPYLAGLRSARQEDMFQEGNTILYSGGLYFRNLSLARLGVLPFFILACVLVWLWSRRLFGNSAALAATLLFSTLPPILAHAGLATTDMAISTFVFGATYAFALWLERPGWKQSVLFGLCVAMATLSKFSALLFLPVCLLVTLLLYLRAERPSIYQASRKIPSAVLVLTVAILVVWAGYRFSFGPLAPDVRVGNRPPQTIDRLVDHVSLPAPELFNGLAEVQFHNSVGHPAWLLGEYSNHGWWYFFPVVLAVKTPIAFILLCIVGYGACFCRTVWKRFTWQQWVPFACAPAILVTCMPTHINIGVRHILVIYPMLAIVAGFGAVSLFQSRKKAAIILSIALLGWQTCSSALAHPDYLAYFNELVWSRPERVLSDSDLDWGQDLQRLSDKLKELGVKEVSLDYFGSADISQHGLPSVKSLSSDEPATGWVAVSVFEMTVGSAMFQEKFHAPYSNLAELALERPVAIIGKSIKLYYVPTTGQP